MVLLASLRDIDQLMLLDGHVHGLDDLCRANFASGDVSELSVDVVLKNRRRWAVS